MTALEHQVKKIDSENRQLKDKLENTNSSVGTFISEMSSLLDSNELQSILNMDVDSDEDGGDILVGRGGPSLDNVIPSLEHDESRPHAGTGGSSKLKSRPNL